MQFGKHSHNTSGFWSHHSQPEWKVLGCGWAQAFDLLPSCRLPPTLWISANNPDTSKDAWGYDTIRASRATTLWWGCSIPRFLVRRVASRSVGRTSADWLWLELLALVKPMAFIRRWTPRGGPFTRKEPSFSKFNELHLAGWFNSVGPKHKRFRWSP